MKLTWYLTGNETFAAALERFSNATTLIWKQPLELTVSPFPGFNKHTPLLWQDWRMPPEPGPLSPQEINAFFFDRARKELQTDAAETDQSD